MRDVAAEINAVSRIGAGRALSNFVRVGEWIFRSLREGGGRGGEVVMGFALGRLSWCDLAVSRTVSQSERMVGGFRSYGFESVSSVGCIMERTFQCFCYFNREGVVVFGF